MIPENFAKKFLPYIQPHGWQTARVLAFDCGAAGFPQEPAQCLKLVGVEGVEVVVLEMVHEIESGGLAREVEGLAKSWL
jgi:hypothetical protein